MGWDKKNDVYNPGLNGALLSFQAKRQITAMDKHNDHEPKCAEQPSQGLRPFLFSCSCILASLSKINHLTTIA
jgi:hypothetical protein